MAQDITAAELTVNVEFIVHSRVAGDLADHYLTATSVREDVNYSTGKPIVFVSGTDRLGEKFDLTLPAGTLATIY